MDGRNGIKIGENVVFASNVRIWTEQHDHRDPWFRCETQKHNPVIIDGVKYAPKSWNTTDLDEWDKWARETFDL